MTVFHSEIALPARPRVVGRIRRRGRSDQVVIAAGATPQPGPIILYAVDLRACVRQLSGVSAKPVGEGGRN